MCVYNCKISRNCTSISLSALAHFIHHQSICKNVMMAHFLCVKWVGKIITLSSSPLSLPCVHSQTQTHTDDIDAGVLDKSSCLSALTELRHAKWFQVGLA